MAAPFPRDTHLTSIAIAYKNPDTALIADSVLPRTDVGKSTFKYYEYPLEEGFTVPDTRVGERSAVPQVEIGGSEETAKVEDFGIEIPLPSRTISESPAATDPRERATERASNIILLDREVRVASVVFNAATYPVGNKVDLAGGGGEKQWSDPTSDPIIRIRTALDQCVVRPNCMALGQLTWSALSVHPAVVSAALGNDGTKGVATRQRVAELLELDELLVGAGMVNSVKPGKTPVLQRVWGKHATAFYRDRTVDVNGGVTFGLTAQLGTRQAGARDVDMGVSGGVMVRAWESVKELIVAPKVAFFFQNAVA